MVSLGQVHLVLALVAIVAGAGVVGMKKGTGLHRLVGFVYALTMFGVLGSAMLIYNLTGDFGPFHVLALVSLVTIIFGYVGYVLVVGPDASVSSAEARAATMPADPNGPGRRRYGLRITPDIRAHA